MKLQSLNDIRLSIVITMALAIWHSLTPLCYEWWLGCPLGKATEWLCCLLDSRRLFATIVALLIVTAALYWSYIIIKDKDRRPYRLLLVVSIFFILWDGNPLRFAALPWVGDFRVLISILCVVLLGVMLTKHRFSEKLEAFFRRSITNRNTKQETVLANHFTDDNINSENIPVSLQHYATSIVERILGTNVRQNSFAVGITGEWGSGKSTFLDAIRKRLENKADIVEFNPWMCSTPEQVTADFFATLRKQLAKTHSSLSAPITDYAKYISSATLSWGGDFLSKLAVIPPRDSLNDKKVSISEKFSRLDKPVVVLIDDLDRLQGDEVFEVLRLIRNTADLKNTFYVVAYDKEYVTSVLQDKGIKEAATYLEKIFPVEIHQPKVETGMLQSTLIEELSHQPSLGRDFGNRLLSHINQNERILLFDVLTNYRKVKRFARLYLLNVAYIQNAYENELKLVDVFWIELLQMYDKDIYDLMAVNPMKLLCRTGGRYELRPGIYDKDIVTHSRKDYEYIGEKVWKEETPHILYTLFNEGRNSDIKSIRHIENYPKYFMLSVPDYKLSFQSYKDYLQGQTSDLSTGWMNGKYFTSIAFHLENTDVASLRHAQLVKYILAVLDLGCEAGRLNVSMEYTVRGLLSASNFKKEQISDVYGYILGWFYSHMKDTSNLLVLAKILKELYPAQKYDEDGQLISKTQYIIKSMDVEMLLNNIMESFLSSHPELTAESVLKENSEMGKLFGACCVMINDGGPNDEFYTWENIVFLKVIRHFSKQPKLAEEVYNNALSRMFANDIPLNINSQEEEEAYQYAFEQRDRELNEYFGSSSEYMKQFKNACFE